MHVFIGWDNLSRNGSWAHANGGNFPVFSGHWQFRQYRSSSYHFLVAVTWCLLYFLGLYIHIWYFTSMSCHYHVLFNQHCSHFFLKRNIVYFPETVCCFHKCFLAVPKWRNIYDSVDFFPWVSLSILQKEYCYKFSLWHWHHPVLQWLIVVFHQACNYIRNSIVSQLVTGWINPLGPSDAICQQLDLNCFR